MVLAETQDSAGQDLSQASNPFQQYRSTLDQISSLQSRKDDARVQAEELEQLYILLTLQHCDYPHAELLKNSALYYWRLMSECVSQSGYKLVKEKCLPQ